MSMLATRDLRRVLLCAAAALLALATIAPGAGAAGGTFSVTFGTCRVFFGGSPNQSLRITRYAPNGAVLGRRAGIANAEGDFTWTCKGRVQGGERLVARTPSGTQIVAFQVPRLTARIDRTEDKLRLRGPKGTGIEVHAQACAAGGFDCQGGPSYSPTFNAQGRVTVDIGADLDLKGDDLLEIRWNGPGGDILWRMELPHVEVALGSARVAGAAPTGDRVTTVFKTGSLVARGKGVATARRPDGRFGAVVRKPNGAKVPLHVGDQVRSTVALDSAFIASAVSFVVEGSSVKLVCLPNATWSAEVRHGTQRLVSDDGPTDGLGKATVNSLAAHLQSGNQVIIRCGTTAGDWITMRQTIS